MPISILTWRQMATLTLHPKEVETALGDKLRPENNFVKASHREIRGRSSATTTQVRTHERLTPRALSCGTEPPRPFVQSSITPVESKTMSFKF